MKKILTTLFLFCSLQLLSAQTVIIKGEKTNRALRWSDFSGEPDHNSSLFAYTYWYVRYQWAPFSFKADTVKWTVEVSLEFEKKSWHKPEKVSDSLLAHEQGHFTIGFLFARSFRERVNRTVFLRHTYERQIASIFQEELEKYRELERRYDKETEHFNNRPAQRKWDDYLKKEMAKPL